MVESNYTRARNHCRRTYCIGSTSTHWDETSVIGLLRGEPHSMQSLDKHGRFSIPVHEDGSGRNAPVGIFLKV